MESLRERGNEQRRVGGWEGEERLGLEEERNEGPKDERKRE